VGTEDRERDLWGQIFAKELASFGVMCALENRKEASGRCLVIHMPGGLKSIACAPGAAPTIHPEQINPSLVTQTKIVHLDGQVLRNPSVTDRIISLCKEHDLLLTVDAASADIICKYTDRILDMLMHTDCILFLNDNEALALAKSLEEGSASTDTGLQTADEYIDTVLSFLAPKKSRFPCIVQKKGPNGAKAWMEGSVYEELTDPIELPLDDTGAGDTFDGAFLAAWLNGATLGECLSFANAAAREVLMVPGTRLDEPTFTALKKERLPGKHS
jgi:sugar/nucleoside kinase (ribokinase family)